MSVKKWVMSDEWWDMSDEWWVMSDENWVTEIEWWFFVVQTGSHILCFLFSLANQTVEIESLPSSSCHSKHSVNQTVKHYLPKVYKSIFYYYYYYFNFKNELYSKYDRNDTNLKFMKLKSNKDFVIIILKWNSPLGRLVLFCKI